MFSSARSVKSALLADPSHVAAGVPLGVVEDSVVDAGLAEHPRERLGDLLVARVERGVVAEEPEELGRLLADVLHLERQVARPAPALALRLPERVARGVDRLERALEERVHLAALDELAAHLVDHRDVLDPDWADLDAGHALHARPERLGLDRVAEDGLARLVQGRNVERRADPHRALGLFPEIEDEVARGERVAGGRRGAGRVALAALRARVEVRRGASGKGRRSSRSRPRPASRSAGGVELPCRPARRAAPRRPGPVSMCTAFVNGIEETKKSAATPCTHHVTKRAVSAA